MWTREPHDGQICQDRLARFRRVGLDCRHFHSRALSGPMRTRTLPEYRDRGSRPLESAFRGCSGALTGQRLASGGFVDLVSSRSCSARCDNDFRFLHFRM